MKTNSSSILNPIKMKHSNSFILSTGEYIGTYNKNNEKINNFISLIIVVYNLT